MSKVRNLPEDTENNSPNSMKLNVNASNDLLLSNRDNESFGSSGGRLHRPTKTVYRSRQKEVLSFGGLHHKGNKKTFQKRLDG